MVALLLFLVIWKLNGSPLVSLESFTSYSWFPEMGSEAGVIGTGGRELSRSLPLAYNFNRDLNIHFYQGRTFKLANEKAIFLPRIPSKYRCNSWLQRQFRLCLHHKGKGVKIHQIACDVVSQHEILCCLGYWPHSRWPLIEDIASNNNVIEILHWCNNVFQELIIRPTS